MHISQAHFWCLYCVPSAEKLGKLPCDSAAVTFLSHPLHKQSPGLSWTSGWGSLPQLCTQENLPCWPQPFQHLEEKEKNIKFVVIIGVMNTLCWKSLQSSFPDVIQLMWVGKHTYICHITSVSFTCLVCFYTTFNWKARKKMRGERSLKKEVKRTIEYYKVRKILEVSIFQMYRNPVTADHFHLPFE